MRTPGWPRCSPGRHCSSRPCFRPATTASRSASSNTITGALPPSSRWVRLIVDMAASITFMPVATLPVTEIMRTPGWLISGEPTLAPRPVTTFRTPAGNSSAQILASLSVVSGVCSEGLRTIAVARRQRRRDLPRSHHQRIVPGGDLRHHADRVTPDHAGVAGQILVRVAARQAAGRTREEAEAVDDRGHLVVEHAHARLAAVERLELGESARLLFDAVGELEQQQRAFLRRAQAPLLERSGARRATAWLTCSALASRTVVSSCAGGWVDDGLFGALARRRTCRR